LFEAVDERKSAKPSRYTISGYRTDLRIIGEIAACLTSVDDG
jgi:hypothetical protein